MLTKRVMAVLGTATLAVALGGCGGGGGGGDDVAAPSVAAAPAPAPVQQAVRLQSVHIVDKGSEIKPSTEVTDFAPGKLSYNLTSPAYVSGDKKFDAALSTEDFDRLAALIESDNLLKTLGEVDVGAAPCRHLGYEIDIKRSDATYHFTIPGWKVCGAAVVPGLLDLLDLQDALVLKYSPKAG